MNEAGRQAKQAAKLAEKVKPFFAGQDPDTVGAALCELVALHQASHFIPGDPESTAELRAMMLEVFVETVKKLTPIMEATEILPRYARMKQ